MVHEYARSGALLGGEEAITTSNKGGGSPSNNNGGSHGFSSFFVDWGEFRGSPASAMEETLGWLRTEYGSVEGYLNDHVGFEAKQREQLGTLLLRNDNM